MSSDEFTVGIDPERCRGCASCIVACPTGSLRPSSSINRHGVHPTEFLAESGCLGCGICAASCPEPNAVEVRSSDAEAA